MEAASPRSTPPSARLFNHRGDLGIGDGRLSSEEERMDRAAGSVGDAHGGIGIGGSAHDPLGCLEVVVERAGHGCTEYDDVASEESLAEQVAGSANKLPSTAFPGGCLYHRAVVLVQCGLARARRLLVGLAGRVRNALPIPREVVVEQPGQDGTDQEDEVVVADAGSPEENVAGAAHLLPSSAVPGDRVFDVTAVVGQLGFALRSSLKDLAGRFRKVLPNPTAVDKDTPADQLEQQRKRCSKYSEKTLLFAITMVAACFAYSSFVNAVFKVSMAFFCMAFVAELISPTMKLKWRIALIYLSWFLLVLMLYLRLVSFNMYYGYAILPVPLPIVAAFLHHKLRPRVQRTTDHNEADLDGIFDLSAGIVNSGGLISTVFNHYMEGPNQSIAVSAVRCLFFFTIVLGLYLMMIATVRNVALTSHVIYLAMLMKVLVVSTLIATLIR